MAEHEQKWTPGPWRRGQGGDLRIYADKSNRTVSVAECHHTFPVRECPANAHLIAAAPTLHDALAFEWAEKLHLFLLSEYAAPPDTGEAVTADVRPHYNALCAFICKRMYALAKARGESS